MDRKRRQLLIATLIGAAGAWAAPISAQLKRPLVEVWKSPTCGCCKDWVAHLEGNGFAVRTFDTGNTAARQRLGMPARFASCHTARVGDYTIEGHVHAREIARLLHEQPDAVGLAVPAMPVGSPGMDGPAYQGRRDPFDVLLVLRDGRSRVYQSYR